jgi:hypothetical protein
MIYEIQNEQDPYSYLLSEDPVRAHIPVQERFGNNRHVFALVQENLVTAIVCCKLCSGIPASEQDLLTNNCANPNTIVFYTIWSYKPGAGQQLIVESLKFAKSKFSYVDKYMTLSPPTEMARRFHLKNGASVYRVNHDTVNYEYK